MHEARSWMRKHLLESWQIYSGKAFNSSSPSATYIYVSVNWVSIGSDNGLSPIQHQVII